MKTPLLVRLLLLAFAILLLSSGTSYAQSTASSAVVSRVGVRNCTQTQNNGTLTIQCDFVNSGDVQPDIRYSVQLIRTSFNDRSIVDEKVYPETFSLAEGQTVRKTITYTIPGFASGFLEVWVNASNSEGAGLAFNHVDTITAQPKSGYAEILTSTCYVQVKSTSGAVSSQQYTIEQGVDIGKNETLVANCSVKNLGSQEVALTPSLATYRRDIFGQTVQTTQASSPTLSLAASQTKNYSFTLPKPTDPQAYDTTLTFQSGGVNMSNSVAFHYIIQGASATIQNISFDKSGYKKGDTAVVTAIWTGSADTHSGSRNGGTDEHANTLSLTITDGSNQTCGEANQDVSGSASGQASVRMFTVPLSRDCSNPHVSVKVIAESGTVLAQKDVSVTSVAVTIPPVSGKKIAMWIIIGIGVLIVLIILWSLVKTLFTKKEVPITDTPIIPIAFFMLLGVSGFFMHANLAHADTFQDVWQSSKATDVRGKNILSTYTVDLDKTVYAPGDEIDVTALFKDSVGTDGSHFGLVLQPENEPTGENYIFLWNSKQQMLQRTTSFTAPVTPGTYRIAFAEHTILSPNKYSDPGTTYYIYYTVAGRASALTLSCSANGGTISQGQPVTWTASASGGDGNYTYSWSGTDDLSGSSATITKSYVNSGSKNGSVTVYDGKKSVTKNCTSDVRVKTTSQPNLTAGTVSPTVAFAGTSVTLNSNVLNIGTAGSGAFPVLFQVRETGEKFQTVSEVNGLGTSNSGAGTAKHIFASAGTYSVRACSNFNTTWKSITAESNYGDNCGPWTQITVKGFATAATNTTTDTLPASSSTNTNTPTTNTTIGTNSGANTTTNTRSNTTTSNANTTISSNTLTASCYVSPTSINSGDTATWMVTAVGGSGAYTYSWSGTDGLSGDAPSIKKSYSTAGIKSAKVTVSTGSQTITQNCNNRVRVSPPAQANLQAGAVSSASVVAGTSVNITATASNVGSAASGDFLMLFQVQETNESFNSPSIGGIPVGGTATGRALHTFSSAGTYHVRACVNQNTSQQAITTESNYSDNCSDWTAVTVSPLPSTLTPVSNDAPTVIISHPSTGGGGGGGGGGSPAPTPDPTPSPTPTPSTTPPAPVLPIPAPTFTPPPGPVTGLRVGTNLNGIANYSGELPFINAFKSAGEGAFQGVDGSNPGYTRDSTGWINGTPVGGSLGWSVPVKSGANYLFLYDGSAAIGAYSGTDEERRKSNVLSTNGTINITSWTPGRIEFTTNVSSMNMAIFNFDPNDPMRNVRIIRADQEALYNSGKVINPDFINYIKHFSAIRTMDWSGTNGSQLVSWSQRPKVTDPFWGAVPLEVQIAAANEANSDLWFNIPAHADDDYIQNAVTMIHNQLSPTLKLHLEYSNEVWNGMFEQSQYAAQRAATLWPASASDNIRAELWYGYRSAQMATIAKQIYGADADTRLAPVLATWSFWTDAYIDNEIADGVSRANLGSIGSLFKEYAVTTYFGDELGAFPGNEADRALLTGWASAPDGPDKAFQEVEHGGLMQNNFSLDRNANLFIRHAAQAHAWGLNMVAYEGGISWYYFLADDKTPFNSLLNKLLDDPRVGQMYTKMMSDFAAAGGTYFMNFSDIGSHGEYGPWGVQTDLYTPSYRSQALIQASGR